MYLVPASIDISMTRVVVVGDAHVGKTRFMHCATGMRIPVNVFRSIKVEYFTMCGTSFVIVPGGATNDVLAGACDQAEGVIVLYAADNGIENAGRWLRCIRSVCSDVLRVPLLLCAHSLKPAVRTVPTVPPAVSALLRQYPNAEHAYTTEQWADGISDCANRIVYRIRRRPPSPLSSYVD